MTDLTKLSPGQIPIYVHALNTFYIPPQLTHLLEKYYLLHWETEYFLETQTRTPCRIIREDIEYLVVRPTRIETPRVKLSFRKLPRFKYGYVLVEPLTASGENI